MIVCCKRARVCAMFFTHLIMRCVVHIALCCAVFSPPSHHVSSADGLPFLALAPVQAAESQLGASGGAGDSEGAKQLFYWRLVLAHVLATCKDDKDVSCAFAALLMHASPKEQACLIEAAQ